MFCGFGGARFFGGNFDDRYEKWVMVFGLIKGVKGRKCYCVFEKLLYLYIYRGLEKGR